MADEKKKRGGDPLEHEKILDQLARGPAQPPAGVTSYLGLLGRSQKEGYWLVYLTLDMSLTVEIAEADIVHSEQLPPDKSPFGSLGGTQVFVRKGAKVTTTRTVSRTTEAGEDDFDLDIRLEGRAQLQAQGLPSQVTCAAECPGQGTGDAQTCLTCVSCGGTCRATCFDTCRTFCDTCPGDTCRTCETCRRTQCGETCQQTCRQATCQTCQTQCGQATCQPTCRATCNTCNTQCGQATCDTCRTQCDTCPGDTCRGCTHITCFRTCDIC